MKDYLGYNNRYKLDDYLNHNGEHLQVNVIRWYKSYFVCNYCDMIGLPYITHVCNTVPDSSFITNDRFFSFEYDHHILRITDFTRIMLASTEFSNNESMIHVIQLLRYSTSTLYLSN